MSEATAGVHRTGRHRGFADTVVGPVARLFFKPAIFRRLYLVPSLPRRFRDRYEPGHRWWSDDTFDVPEQLRAQPGIRRDPEAEAAAFAQAPVYDWLAHVPDDQPARAARSSRPP